MTTLPLPGGDTSYLQTSPASPQITAFNTSSGTVSTQLNLSQIRWNSVNNMMLYKDGVTVLSLPGTQETFVGYNTNLINAGGVFNTSLGSAAMPYPNVGNFNNCIGNSCMSGNLLSGENNNAMGYASLGTLSSGFYNNAVGGSSLNLLTSGSGNSCVGAYSCNRNATADGNTGVGYRALFVTTGTLNTGVGYESGSSTDTANYTQANGGGIHNTYIGAFTGQDVSSSTILSNSVAIGYQALFHKSNQAQIGGQQGSGNELTVLVSTMIVYNHISNTTNKAPTISACGVTPSGTVVGGDTAGTISIGGGVVTACTLTFAVPYTNTPACVVSDNSTAVAAAISSISNTAVTFSFSATLGSGKTYYHCFGNDAS